MITFKRDFDFNENLLATVANNIRKYRIQKGITQEQLAIDIGISYEYLRRVETQNGSKGLSFETIYKASVVLGVPLDKLVEIDEKK